MYDYEYEEDVLAVLRMLKLLKERQPERYRAICEQYEEVEWQFFDELAWTCVWEVFDETFNDFDPDYEVEIMVVEDAALDRFWTNLQKKARESGSYSLAACRSYIRDTTEYFLRASSYTVAGIECITHEKSLTLKLWISPDTYNPVEFATDIVTFLQYLQAENEKNTARPKKRRAKKAKIEEKEAA